MWAQFVLNGTDRLPIEFVITCIDQSFQNKDQIVSKNTT